MSRKTNIVSTAPWIALKGGEIVGFKNGIEETICNVKMGLSYSEESKSVIVALPEILNVIRDVSELFKLLDFIPTGYLTRREMRTLAKVNRKVSASFLDLLERHGNSFLNL